MGFIKTTLSFLIGTACGAYAAQNYNVPDVRKFLETGVLIAKHFEEQKRKTTNRRDGDDD